MKAVLLDVSLALAVLSVWVGCLGVIRMRSALDRLHAVAFTNVAGTAFVVVAGFIADGVSPHSVKHAFLLIVVVVTGAATSHAAGRAIALRDGPQA